MGYSEILSLVTQENKMSTCKTSQGQRNKSVDSGEDPGSIQRSRVRSEDPGSGQRVRFFGVQDSILKMNQIPNRTSFNLPDSCADSGLRSRLFICDYDIDECL